MKFVQTIIEKIKVRKIRLNARSKPGPVSKKERSKVYSKLKSRTLYSLIIFLLLPTYLGVIIYKVSRIELRNYSGTEEAQVEWNGVERLNILLVGVDEQENDYDFVDYLTIIEIDTQNSEVKILNVNTLFVSEFLSESEVVTLKNVLAYSSSQNKETALMELVKDVQVLTALRVDGYIYTSQQGFLDVFSGLGEVDVVTPSSISDKDLGNDFSVSEGVNKISYPEFLPYVSADENGQNDKMERQIGALQGMMTETNMFRLLIDLDDKIVKVEEGVKTNLTLKSLLKMIYILKFKENEYKVNYTHSHPGYVIDSSVGRVWRPVYEDVDVDIKKIFTSNNVKLEQPRVDILNSTERGGFARVRGRWLENKGIRVVKTDNYPDKLSTSRLYVEEPEKYSYTIQEIQETFYGDIEIIKHPYPGRFVGEIVIVLGENELMY